MTLLASDFPPSLPCGEIDQDWINLVTDWRARSYSEIVSIQNELSSFRQTILDDIESFRNEIGLELSSIRADLPRIAYNEINPRFYAASVIKVGTTASITLPSGGTYYGQFTVNMAEDGINILGKDYLISEGNEERDRVIIGTKTGSFPGGFIETISDGDDLKGTISFFGFRRD